MTTVDQAPAEERLPETAPSAGSRKRTPRRHMTRVMVRAARYPECPELGALALGAVISPAAF